MPIVPGASPRFALQALQTASRGRDVLEVLTVRGRHPARQRNLAAQRARGAFLYFLDHDSRVSPDSISRLLAAFQKSDVAAAGGPNPGVRRGGMLSQAIELVLGSRLGSLTVRSRYAPTGTLPRPAGEESLILCNLMVRKEAFLDLGGFDPRLYPNEENEFISRAMAHGWTAVYEPKAQAAKPRAAGLLAYIVENFRYARGRMEQAWVNVHTDDVPYLSGLAVLTGGLVAAWHVHGILWLVPVYLVAVAFEALRLTHASGAPVSRRGWTGPLAALTGILITLRHTFYALGLIWGALTGWRKRGVQLPSSTFWLGSFRFARGRITREPEVALALGPGRI